MARQRRGGFRPPELRGTLGTLLRTTLEQAGVVRDAISRGARSRFDEARSHRRRQDALLSLGELVLDLIRRGEIDLAELPEARDLIQLLDDLDASAPSDPDDRIAQPPTRGRFDARPPASAPVRPRHDDDAAEGDGYGYDRGHAHPHDEDGHDHARPRARRASIDSSFDRAHPHHAVPDDGHDHDRARPRRRDEDVDDGDGTVAAPRGTSSSGPGTRSGARDRSSAPRDDGTVSAIRGGDSSGPGARSGRGAPPPASPQRVWRPSLPDDEPPPEPPAPRDARSARSARRPPADPPRQGGIQFDDDEDLADYMHPDDVPPKPPADDDR
jgi:hypothetical protein